MKKYSDDIIQQIIDNVDILEYISRFVELEKHGKEYFGQCPFHREDTPSFSVSPDKKIFCCFGCGAKSSVIDFVMLWNKLSFNKAVELLLQGAENIDVDAPRSRVIEFLKCANKVCEISRCRFADREILPNDIMNKFKKDNIREWISEDISQEVMDKYQVRYDTRANRIVFPIFDIDGNIINVKGRTLYHNYKELGLTKYIYYYPLQTLDFLYGYYQKKDICAERKEVIVFEGSKSVLKLESWNIHNAMSLETSKVNETQINLLLRLKCDIVFALDNGVSREKLKNEITKLKRFTNVYWIEDKHKILKPKDAPCDQGMFNFLQLYEERMKL